MHTPTTDSPNVARTSSGHITDVTTTALTSRVRLQVWDGLAPSDEPCRLADVHLTLPQARRLIAELTIAADRAMFQQVRP